MYRPTTTLQQRFWDSKLRMEAVLADPFQMFEGSYNDQKKAIPNGIKMHVNLKGKRSAVIGLLKRLSGAGVTGRDTLIGNEVDQDTRELIVYANELRHAVNAEMYGIDANEKSPYKLLEAIQPSLSFWLAEMKGKYIREAIVEKYSVNLTVAPISATKAINENVLVKNVALASQPAYGASAAAFLENIGDALTAAGVTSAAQWDVTFLSRIQYWATVVKKIQPLDNGRFVVMVPSRQAAFLKDPQNTESLFGVHREASMVELAKKWSVDQYLGSYGMLDMFEDPRNPVADLGGSNGSWTVAFKYKGAGDDDDRTSTSGVVFDVGMILGKGAVIETEYEPPHFEDEVQDYNMIKGIGIATGFGFQRTVFFNDATSETRASTINQYSGILLAYGGTLTA